MTAALIFSIALVVVTAVYIGLLTTFAVGLSRLRQNRSVSPESWPSVSIVLPARNEEDVLPRTLASLREQDYAGDWEVIVVDDRSSDSTPLFLEKMASEWLRLKVIHITEPDPPSPKKNALAKGIFAARGEIIITTDADCIYHPHWTRGMVSQMIPEAGVVAGLTVFESPNQPAPLWQQIQGLDFFVQNFMAAAAMGMDHPASCNGSNLAFRREVYNKVSGWGEHARVVSGDDVLFAQRVARETQWKSVFSTLPETLVKSLPVENIHELMHQRLRWASKGLTYRPSMLFFLFGIYAYYLALLVSPIFMLLAPSTIAWILPTVAAKTFMDYLVVRSGCKVFAQESRIKYFWIYSFLQLIFVPYFGLAGLLVPYRWKGDWYRTARMPRTMRRGWVRVRRIVRSRRHAESTIS